MRCQPAAAVAQNFHEKKHFNGGFPENDFGETRKAAIKAPIHGRAAEQQQVVIRLDAADERSIVAACTKGYARVAKWKQEISFPLYATRAAPPASLHAHIYTDRLALVHTNNFIIYPCKSSRTHFYYIVSLSPLSVCEWVRERNGAFLFTSTENCCGSGFIRELLQNIVYVVVW